MLAISLDSGTVDSLVSGELGAILVTVPPPPDTKKMCLHDCETAELFGVVAVKRVVKYTDQAAFSKDMSLHLETKTLAGLKLELAATELYGIIVDKTNSTFLEESIVGVPGEEGCLYFSDNNPLQELAFSLCVGRGRERAKTNLAAMQFASGNR